MMKVYIYGELSYLGERTIPLVGTIPKLLSEIERAYGIIQFAQLRDYSIVLVDSSDTLDPLRVNVNLLDVPISSYDKVIFVPRIYGSEPFSFATTFAVSTLGLEGTAAAAVAWTITIATIITVSYAMNQIMQAISPTPTIKNAKEAQKRDSNLWNGGQATLEQGGPLPMAFGNPFCSGGVIIASSISTEDRSVNTPVTAIIDKSYSPLVRAGWV